jgi:radical SAM superfamily enzyme YgiQ (UPF0313 family)
MLTASKKIVLYMPAYDGPPLGPPAGLLSLASPLLQAGYHVQILDGKILPEVAGEIKREVQGALCFGISLLTGPMIDGAIRAARLVKSYFPSVPIVFGGWHPSLLPEQTLCEPFADVVVRHQGEVTFLELVERLSRGESLDGLAGCWSKSGSEIRRNPDRPAARLSELPSPAYHLADFDAYEQIGGGRKLPYASSVGCPYTCNYCTDTVFYNRRFNAYPAERVVEELVHLVRRFRIQEVSLLDSNFLVDTRRAVRIAAGLLDAGATFQWTFQASTDLLCRMSDEDVRLLARSGVRHIGFGTESGSEEVLQSMDKHHQKVGDMFETARKCFQSGIRATFNLIFGFPGETEKQRHETLRLMGQIAERYDNVTFSPNIFTPYPGITVWPELERLGLRQPESMKGWQKLVLGANMLPWMQGEALRNVQRSCSFFLMANQLAKAASRSTSRLEQQVLRLLRRPLCWRLTYHFNFFPVEVWLYKLRNQLLLRRSLLTGDALGRGGNEAR